MNHICLAFRESSSYVIMYRFNGAICKTFIKTFNRIHGVQTNTLENELRMQLSNEDLLMYYMMSLLFFWNEGIISTCYQRI